MKNYPEILYPHEAKVFTDDEETELLEAIVSVNDQLRSYDGHPIEISIPAHTKRVRAQLIERISDKRWSVKVQDAKGKSEIIPVAAPAGAYRTNACDYNEEKASVLVLTESK